ncbi:chemotaxis protein, partial [Xanthomonas perforans]
ARGRQQEKTPKKTAQGEKDPPAAGQTRKDRETPPPGAGGVSGQTGAAETPPVRGATNALAATKPAAAKHAVHEHRRRA